MASPGPADLVQRVLAGEPRAVARMLRRVDDRTPGYLAELEQLYPHTGRAYLIGITGTPGAGKSTLVDALVGLLRERDLRVGVLAVDPSSPFSGGAILGDRIRMQRHCLDEKVFIRSLSTRGQLGGLSRSALDSARVLDASGCDVILVESVGVGQDELEIAQVVHSTVVLLAPGGGDDIQAIKAGILEIADVLAVNKADREGADDTARDLEGMLSLAPIQAASGPRGHAAHGPVRNVQTAGEGRWCVPVLKVSALRNQGVSGLLEACEKHRAYLEGSEAGRERMRSKRQAELRRTLRELVIEHAERELAPELTQAMERAGSGEDPYVLAQTLVSLLSNRGA
ncbi:MAG: methylmalonyl Co-A mutase-associated GTPase MeaB [Myxococcales bacterium]